MSEVKPGDPRRHGLPHVFVTPTRWSTNAAGRRVWVATSGPCVACGADRDDRVHQLTPIHDPANRPRPPHRRRRRRLPNRPTPKEPA